MRKMGTGLIAIAALIALAGLLLSTKVQVRTARAEAARQMILDEAEGRIPPLSKAESRRVVIEVEETEDGSYDDPAKLRRQMIMLIGAGFLFLGGVGLFVGSERKAD